MAGKASVQNGKLGGRPKGRKNDTTLLKEAELSEFQKLVKERMLPLFNAQMQIALGTAHLFRIDEGPKGGRDHVLVTDVDEIGDILAQMHQQEIDSGPFNDKYYYITVKAPDNKAIDSLLDRAYGKPTQTTELKGKLTISQLLDALEHGQAPSQ